MPNKKKNGRGRELHDSEARLPRFIRLKFNRKIIAETSYRADRDHAYVYVMTDKRGKWLRNVPRRRVDLSKWEAVPGRKRYNPKNPQQMRLI